MSEAPQRRQRTGDDRHIGNLVLTQMPRLGARIGDQLLAIAIIELLGNRQCLIGSPAPFLRADLLQGRKIIKFGRSLPLTFDFDTKRSPKIDRGFCNGVSPGAILDALLRWRRMANEKAAARSVGHCGDLEIVLRFKVADFQFAQANDSERRRLHPSDADHAARARREQRLGSRAGERQVVDLVRLLARHRRLIERTQFMVRLERGEGLPDGLWILSGEECALDRTAIT